MLVLNHITATEGQLGFLKMFPLALLFISSISGAAHAETVFVKYRGEVPLTTFWCRDIDRSSVVERVCFDDSEDYMLVKLNGTYYHYCEIGSATVDAFLSAESMGRYFNRHIKGSGSTGPFDCRTHRVPVYATSD